MKWLELFLHFRIIIIPTKNVIVCLLVHNKYLSFMNRGISILLINLSLVT